MAVVVPIVSEWNPKGVNRALADIKKAEGKLGKINAGLSKAFLPATAALAGLAAGAWSAAKAGEELASSQAALRQVMSQMGYSEATDRLTKLADEMERTLGVDEKLILQVQTTLGTFSELAASADQAGGAFDRTTMAALDLAAAGFGTAESNAIQLGKALNDPVKGLTALTRSGVTFTAAEQDKIKVLVESGKQLEAQDMILKAIEKQVGGTAEATADSSAKMSLAFADVKESIGVALLPLFDELNDKLASFARWAQDNTGLIIGVATAIGTLAAALVTAKIALIAYEIATGAAAIATTALGAASNLTAGKLLLMGGRAGVAGLALGATAGSAVLLKDRIDGVRESSQGFIVDAGKVASVAPPMFATTAIAVTELLKKMDDSAEASRSMTSATVSSAIAAGEKLAPAARDAAGAVNELGQETAEAGNSALEAAGSYLALWESIAVAQRAQRDFANTSGTVSSAIAEGAIMGPNPALIAKVEDRYKKLEKTTSSGASKVVKEVKKYDRELLASLKRTDRGWELTVRNLERLTPKMQREVNRALKEHNAFLAEQMDIATKYLADAEAAHKEFADNVRNALAPSLSGAWEQARAAWEEGGKKGAIDYIGAFTRQLEERQWFANVLHHLTANEANPQLIAALVAMGPTEGGALGQAIITDGAIPKMNELLAQGDAIAESTSKVLADEFYGAGIEMGNSLIDAVKAQALSRLAELRELGAQLAAAVNQRSVATAGSVSTGRSRSGSVVNVNVSAGIGDPIAIARQIEDVLRTSSRRLG